MHTLSTLDDERTNNDNIRLPSQLHHWIDPIIPITFDFEIEDKEQFHHAHSKLDLHIKWIDCRIEYLWSSLISSANLKHEILGCRFGFGRLRPGNITHMDFI